MITSLTILLLLSLGIGDTAAQEPEPGGEVGAQATVGTGFTYQGRLTDGGSPANGEYDFRFRLYDASSGGSQVGSTNTVGDMTVTEGLFTVELNFGAVFGGTAYWLDIGVRPGGSSVAYTALTPRQPLTPAPYAHTLRPGADIAGAVGLGGILNVMNLDGAGDGLRVDLVGDDGVQVAVARGNGLYVDLADENGLRVDSAGYDGVYVYSAGNPSTYVSLQGSNGFEVAGAENHGLWVGRADDDGIYVHSAGHNGVYVYTAGDDGVYVDWAGSPSTTNPSTDSNGFEVAGAEGHGLYVGQADADGVYVDSAGGNGVYVDSADDSGVYVESAGNGLEVGSVVNDGVYVSSAGYFGLYVGSAEDGVCVDSADHDGVVVNSAGDDGVHVYSADDHAGVFQGDVWVSGLLTKGGLSFKIDHPLDPENKYLYHSGVESPDMMNVYNGNVTLDDNGEAWITLPDWFEALNRDFRYQLTCIGGFAPVYIAQEIRDNRFQIAGGTPGMKVSWQVTGIRQDPYAEANRIPVEEEKPAEERGVYLHPEAYGQPETMGLAYREAQAHQANRSAAGR